MTLREFQRQVRKEFGSDLERMTPANVREFVDRVQTEVAGPPAPGNGRIYLNESQTTYEAILRDFLSRVLELPNDQGYIQLWMLVLDLAYADIRDHAASHLEGLFSRRLMWDENGADTDVLD